MPRVEFDECPWFDYQYRDEAPVVVAAVGLPFESERYLFGHLPRRVYGWHVRRTNAERIAIDDFLRDRNVTHEAFYVLDPLDPMRTGVDLGTGTGAKTVFDLPALGSGEEARFYSKDDADLVVRVSGSPVTVASVDVDARTITLAAPPARAAPVEADYNGLRLVRLAGPFEWKGVGAGWFDAVLPLEEILRD